VDGQTTESNRLKMSVTPMRAVKVGQGRRPSGAAYRYVVHRSVARK
jgi:hypothetical protein